MTESPAWQRMGSAAIVSPAPLTMAQIIGARRRIAGIAMRTPLRRSEVLSRRCGVPVYLKIETMQPTGTFKIRGAASQILALGDTERRAGVITVSTGNHGRAVAYVARALGIRCVVCLSSLVPTNKISAIAALEAEVDVGGPDQDAAYARATARAAADGLTLVPPFDHPAVIAGQGTIALEIAEDMSPVGTNLVPLSGGGLIGGIAVVAKALDPATQIIGISSARSPAMLESLKAGRPITVEEKPSLADSLGGGIGLDNAFTFPIVRNLVDQVRVVDDEEISDAIRFAFETERLVLEGAGAAGIAALLGTPPGLLPGPIVAVATGDNIDLGVWLASAAPRAPA